MSVAMEHVPDTESLPTELNFLNGIEELIRCPICFDYLQAPMLLPGCDHNYCSLCIRKYLTHKEQCPACGVSASSNQLRNNHILAKVIQQLNQIVAPLKAVCQGNGGHQAALTVDQSRDNMEAEKRNVLHTDRSPPVKLRTCRSTRTNCKDNAPMVTKQKAPLDTSTNLTSQSDIDSDDSDIQVVSESNPSVSGGQRSASGITGSHPSPSFVGSPRKTVQSKIFSHLSGTAGRSKSPDSVGKGESSSKENLQVSHGRALNFSSRVTSPLVSSQIRNSEMSPSSKLSSVLLKSPDRMSNFGGSSSQHSAPPSKTQHTVLPGSISGSSPTVEKVPCPVCGVSVVSRAVNRHLDLCLASQDRKFSHSQGPSEKRKALPKLVYNLLSEKDIRKRLKQLGLNTQGDRQVMIKRHHEFTLYYNADCDSLAPKDMKDLVTEFEETQRLQKKLSSKSSDGQSILRFSKDFKKEDIEKANKEYAVKHQSQFKDLVKQARSRMKSARKTNSPDTAPTTAGPSTKVSQEHSVAQTTPTEDSQQSCSFVNSQQSCYSLNGSIDDSEEEDCSQGVTLKPCLSVVASGDVSDGIENCSGDDGSDDDGLESENGDTALKSGKSSKQSEYSENSTAKVSSSPLPSGETPVVLSEVSTIDTELDTGEDTCSEVFVYKPDSMTVVAKKRNRKALRPSKISWIETDLFESQDDDSDFTISDHSQSNSLSDSSVGRPVSRSLSKSSVKGSKTSESSGVVVQPDLSQSSSLPGRMESKELPCTSLVDGGVSEQCAPNSDILPVTSNNLLPAEPLLDCDHELQHLKKFPTDTNGISPKKAKRRKITCASVTDIESLSCKPVNLDECERVLTEHSKAPSPVHKDAKPPVSIDQAKLRKRETRLGNEEPVTGENNGKDVEAHSPQKLPSFSEVSLSSAVVDEPTSHSPAKHQETVVYEDASLLHQEDKAADTAKEKKSENHKLVEDDPELVEDKTDSFENLELINDSTESCIEIITDSSECFEVDVSENLESDVKASTKLKSLLKKKRKSDKLRQHMKSVRFTGLRARVSDIINSQQDDADTTVKSSKGSRKKGKVKKKDVEAGDVVDNDLAEDRDNNVQVDTKNKTQRISQNQVQRSTEDEAENHQKTEVQDTREHKVPKSKKLRKSKKDRECDIKIFESHHSPKNSAQQQNREDETCHSRKRGSKGENKHSSKGKKNLNREDSPKHQDQHLKKHKDQRDKTDKPRYRKKHKDQHTQNIEPVEEDQETVDSPSTHSYNKSHGTSELRTAVSPPSTQGMQEYQALTEEEVLPLSQAVAQQSLADIGHKSGKRKANFTHMDEAERRKTSAKTKEEKRKKKKDSQDRDSDEDFNPSKSVKLSALKLAQGESTSSSDFFPGENGETLPVIMKKRNEGSRKQNYLEVEEDDSFNDVEISNDYVEENLSPADVVKTRCRKGNAKHSSKAKEN